VCRQCGTAATVPHCASRLKTATKQPAQRWALRSDKAHSKSHSMDSCKLTMVSDPGLALKLTPLSVLLV
jgi:hypothetical protein